MRPLVVGFLLAAGAAGASALEGQGGEPPIAIRRAAGPIAIDGGLDDPGWRGAARFDAFLEGRPGDNVPPRVRTTLLLAYDDRYFYAAFDCEDPDPASIRGYFTDRDDVGTDQDYAGLFLDTRHDHRTVSEFFANPRGVQYDAVQDDATGSEDSSPDFFWDSAGRIGKNGWTLEMRIPFSSLRYGSADPQTWGIIAMRNSTREDRYQFFSSRIPRGSPCFVCHERELTGLAGLPSSTHWIAAPYAAARETGGPAGSPDGPLRGDAGLDAKWIPSADTAFDATIRPDFSQVESDVAQIAVNSRFALFYPEKRPFFLEGSELLRTPIPAVSTRTLTSPRWGIRATGKAGSTAYTVLAADDRGGGTVVLPGPEGSEFAPQDFRSFAAIGRVRRDFGRSFASFLATDRENRGGGSNRVFGPDFQWISGDDDQVTGQALFSRTKDPDRPDLSPLWRGGERSGHALDLAWNHGTRRLGWLLEYRDFGDGFRADDGFVPQVGYRRAVASVFWRLYPKGIFNRLTPLFVQDESWDRGGRLLLRRSAPGIRFAGKAGSSGEVDVFFDRVRVGGREFDVRQGAFTVELSPSRFVTRVAADGALGEDVDVVNVRPGRGGHAGLAVSLRPTRHLGIDLSEAWQWLDVDLSDGSRPRLFRARVERLKVTYNFDARAFVRAVASYTDTDRDPSLYGVPVPRREGTLSVSALFAYKLNWQTVFFLGYGDDRIRDEREALVRQGRQLFLKISYAIAR